MSYDCTWKEKISTIRLVKFVTDGFLLPIEVCHGNVVYKTEYDYERRLFIGRRKHPGLGTAQADRKLSFLGESQSTCIISLTWIHVKKS